MQKHDLKRNIEEPIEEKPDVVEINKLSTLKDLEKTNGA